MHRTSRHVATTEARRLRAFWKSDGKTRHSANERRIVEFLKSNRIEGESITYFMHAEEHADRRRSFVEQIAKPEEPSRGKGLR